MAGVGVFRKDLNIPLINPVVLVEPDTQVLQVFPHLLSGFGHLRQLSMNKLLVLMHGLLQLCIHDRIATEALIFWQDSHPIEGDPIRFLDLTQQADDSNRPQLPAVLLHGSGDIREGEHKTYNLIIASDQVKDGRIQYG